MGVPTSFGQNMKYVVGKLDKNLKIDQTEKWTKIKNWTKIENTQDKN